MLEEKELSINALSHTKDISQYLLHSLEKDYPPIYMNHTKELEVSEVVDD